MKTSRISELAPLLAELDTFLNSYQAQLESSELSNSPITRPSHSPFDPHVTDDTVFLQSIVNIEPSDSHAQIYVGVYVHIHSPPFTYPRVKQAVLTIYVPSHLW